MHQFSFNFADPFFDLPGWQAGLQVITFENIYGLDAARTQLRLRAGGFVIAAAGPPRLRRIRPPSREHS